MLEAYELNPSISHLLPERTRYVDIGSNKYHQYYIDLVELNIPEFKKAEFEIIITTEQSKKLSTRFYSCKKEHGKDCELKSSEISMATLKNKDIEEINANKIENIMDGVKIYKFNISANKFSKVANQTDVKKYTLVVVMQNKEDT